MKCNRLQAPVRESVLAMFFNARSSRLRSEMSSCTVTTVCTCPSLPVRG